MNYDKLVVMRESCAVVRHVCRPFAVLMPAACCSQGGGGGAAAAASSVAEAKQADGGGNSVETSLLARHKCDKL